MPNLFMREVLLRELRTHRISVDRLAGYLLVMTETSVPCPRCYAHDVDAFLVIADFGDGTEHGSCGRCAASFVWPAP
jgi:hypothetical protein